MSNRFHNKWHRHNHHTYPLSAEPDSSHDPIASPSDPFKGDFVIQGSLSASAPTSAYAGYFTSNNTALCAIGGTTGFYASGGTTGIYAVGVSKDNGDIKLNEFGSSVTYPDISKPALYVDGSVNVLHALTAQSIWATQLYAASSIVQVTDMSLTEMSGFRVIGPTAQNLTITPYNFNTYAAVTLSGVPVSGNCWASFDGDLGTHRNLYVDNTANIGGCLQTDCISSHTVGQSAINIWNNINMHGYSISGIGNNSLAFQTGLKLGSNLDIPQNRHDLIVGDGSHAVQLSLLGNVSANGFDGSMIQVGNTNYHGSFGSANLTVGGEAGTDKEIWLHADTSNLRIATISENDILFATNNWNNVRMVITSGGNVGIGTNKPLYKLDVKGNSIFEDAYPEFGTAVTTNNTSPGNYIAFSMAVSSHPVWNIGMLSDNTGFFARGSDIGSPCGVWFNPEYTERKVFVNSPFIVMPSSGLGIDGDVFATKNIIASQNLSAQSLYASGVITALSGNSTDWNITHTIVQANSAIWSSAAAGSPWLSGSGLYSVILDPVSISSGDYSVAEGVGTTASGRGSHTEGHSTVASNDYTHAEGAGTIASGRNSHAEGFNTIASNNDAHAEGMDTTASGFASHAEGMSTSAIGYVSHAAGQLSYAFHDNTYVWSSFGTPVSSTTTSQYTVSAVNGVRLGTNVEIGGNVSFVGSTTYVGPVTASGSFLTVTVNGSAMKIPLYL